MVCVVCSSGSSRPVSDSLPTHVPGADNGYLIEVFHINCVLKSCSCAARHFRQVQKSKPKEEGVLQFRIILGVWRCAARTRLAEWLMMLALLSHQQMPLRDQIPLLISPWHSLSWWFSRGIPVELFSIKCSGITVDDSLGRSCSSCVWEMTMESFHKESIKFKSEGQEDSSWPVIDMVRGMVFSCPIIWRRLSKVL